MFYKKKFKSKKHACIPWLQPLHSKSANIIESIDIGLCVVDLPVFVLGFFALSTTALIASTITAGILVIMIAAGAAWYLNKKSAEKRDNAVKKVCAQSLQNYSAEEMKSRLIPAPGIRLTRTKQVRQSLIALRTTAPAFVSTTGATLALVSAFTGTALALTVPIVGITIAVCLILALAATGLLAYKRNKQAEAKKRLSYYQSNQFC